MSKKKVIIGMLVGAFVMAGVFVPYITLAAQREGGLGGHGPAIMVERMAAELGIDKGEALKYCQQGVKPHELSHAAILAKISGKSLNDILAMKTLANTWRDVEKNLGVSREQIHAVRQDMMASRMEKNLSISKQEIVALLQQGYKAKDITMASVLSKNANKPIADVLAMKKINNGWHDVAASLGVSDDTLRQEMHNIHSVMFGRPDGHFGFGYERNNECGNP